MTGQHDPAVEDIVEPPPVSNDDIHVQPVGNSWYIQSRVARRAYAHYEENSDIVCLNMAIDLFQGVVNAAADADALALSWLGHCLHLRLEEQGTLEDLERALAAERKVLEQTPDGHSDRALALGNLAFSLKHRYMRLGTLDDLNIAIELQQRSLALASHVHPDQPMRLDEFAALLSLRFERFGVLRDLDDAVLKRQLAVELAPEDHPDKALRIINLVASLCRRFEHLRNPDDIELAVKLGYRIEKFTSESDVRRDTAARLDTLGYLQQVRFSHLGELENLERSVVLRQRAVELTADTHPRKANRLHNLAFSLCSRFERLGDYEDLERSITAERRAIELTPNDARDKPLRLSSLGDLWHIRHKQFEQLEDLESAVAVKQLAIELTPDGHRDEAVRLNNLAISLRRRFEFMGNRVDLERAIVMQARAIELTPDSYPDAPARFDNLGYLLYLRYDRFGEHEGLGRAIAEQRRAVELTADDRLDKADRLHNLGVSLTAQARREGTADSFNEALACFMASTSYSSLSPASRLNTAKSAVAILNNNPEFSTPKSLLLAHSRILNIIPEIVWLGHSLTRRLQESRQLGELVSSAVCAAIGADALEQAVEWFDAGRALIWTQTLSLRSPLHELEQVRPDLALSLNETHAQLQGSINSIHQVDFTSTAGYTPIPDLDTAHRSHSDQHRELAIKHGKLLAEVRSLPGFESFMRPNLKRLAALLPLSTSLTGPVVFINVDRAQCDALIVLPSGRAVAIALTELSLEKTEALRARWLSCLEQQNVRKRGSSSYHQYLSSGTIVSHVLGSLWKWVVGPVLEVLGMHIINTDHARLPHVTWCTSGPLSQMPLHAAGIYDKGTGPRVYDLVVSSYVPSLSALMRAVDGFTKRRTTSGLLVITQPDTPGYLPLPGTTTERTRLQEIFAASQILPFTLDGEKATISAVKGVLGEHSWLHLACHGSQDTIDPLKSGFALYDSSLTLSELMATTADNAELAFLSACQTAVGDEKIPEESMHLAAGMLAVGFKGVVATMWSIHDDDAPLIVEAYYRKLLELHTSDSLGKAETGAAYALHEATRKLRESVGEKNIVRWAPFVHFGI